MNRVIKFVIVMNVLFLTGYSLAMDYSKDDLIVNAIKKESNLTQSDVDRWKLLWLGVLAQPVAGAGAVYSAYKAGVTGYSRAGAVYQEGTRYSDVQTYGQTLVKNVFKGAYTPQIIKDANFSGYEQWLGNKWVWAGVGVAGTILASYKLLYPRIQAGILDKLHTFSLLCARLAVTSSANPQQNNGYAALGDLLQAMADKRNTVWQNGSFNAQYLGCENLKEQIAVALQLIDQLVAGGGIDELALEALRKKINWYRFNLSHNQLLIEQGVRVEDTQRAEDQKRRLAGLAVQRAELGVQSQQIKNVASQWKFLKDVANTVAPVVKKYGPPVAAAVVGSLWWNKYMYPQSNAASTDNSGVASALWTTFIGQGNDKSSTGFGDQRFK